MRTDTPGEVAVAAPSTRAERQQPLHAVDIG